MKELPFDSVNGKPGQRGRLIQNPAIGRRVSPLRA